MRKIFCIRYGLGFSALSGLILNVRKCVIKAKAVLLNPFPAGVFSNNSLWGTCPDLPGSKKNNKNQDETVLYFMGIMMLFPVKCIELSHFHEKSQKIMKNRPGKENSLDLINDTVY